MATKPLKAQLASKGLYDDSSGKARERNILNGFVERLQLGVHWIESSERPDFLLDFEKSHLRLRVGIEITEYFASTGKRGADQARFVQKWKWFAKLLRSRLDSVGLPHLYGAIHFKSADWRVLDGFDTNAFIAEVCSSAKQSIGDKIVPDPSRFPLLSARVAHISLFNAAPEMDILWWPSHLQSGVLQDPCERFVQITADKGSRSYEWKGADEKWLLIYCASEGIMNTTGGYADPEIRRHLGAVIFDRVYVWNKFLESIDEIYPTFQNIFSAESEVLFRRYYPPKVRPFVEGRK